MRYSEFDALCRSQWDRDRGDVTALSLTGPSAAELSEYMLRDPGPASKVLRIRAEGAPRIAGGVAVTEARNPVTLSPVSITAGAEADTATVRSGPGGTLTRTVPVR